METVGREGSAHPSSVPSPIARTEQLRVGVVGTGPWAALFHAPMFAGHPATRLAAVWGRRRDAAAEIAARHGAEAHDDFDRFLAGVDAVSFAVPPDVQADLAVTAARAGKALLLEKPLALDPGAAESLVHAVDEAGVPTQLLLTWRYAGPVRAMLAAAARARPIGGRGHFLTGGLLGGVFATPWRLEHGPLFDLGPHVIDLLDAALGPVVGIRAHGDGRGWVGLLLEHSSGAVSEASLTGCSGVPSPRAGIEVHTREGVLEVDTTSLSASVTTTVVDEFTDVVRSGRSHVLDVHRGLHLQHLLTSAASDLRWG